MNKQELIEKIAESVKNEILSGNYYRQVDNYGYTEYDPYDEDDAQGVANDIILDLEEKLDETQKPKTEVFNHDEKFVVEWLDHTTGYHYSLYNAVNDAGSEVRSWMKIGFNSNRFARAFMSMDYEVEKEPLYRVKLGEGYFVEYQGRGALIMPDCNKEIKIFDSKSDAERTAQTIGGTVEEVAER